MKYNVFEQLSTNGYVTTEHEGKKGKLVTHWRICQRVNKDHQCANCNGTIAKGAACWKPGGRSIHATNTNDRICFNCIPKKSRGAADGD